MLALSAYGVKAQDPRILDSLERVIATAQNDTSRAEAYVALTEQYFAYKPDTVPDLCSRSLAIVKAALEEPKRWNEQERRAFKRIQATAYNNIGAYHYSQGALDSAVHWMRRALAVHRSIDNLAGIADALNNIGLLSGMQGDLREQEHCLREALALYRQRKDRKHEADACNNLATWFKDQAMRDSAFVYLRIAMATYVELKDREGQANAHLNLGYNYREAGDIPEALDHLGIARQIYDSLGMETSLVVALNNIASVYADQGLKEEALAFHRRSLEVCDRTGNKQEAATCHLNIGSILEDVGEHDLALVSCQQALKLYEETGDQPGQSLVHGHIGDILKHMGDRAGARKAFERSLSIAQSTGAVLEESTAWYKLGQFLKEAGDLEGASTAFRKSLDMDIRSEDRASEAYNRVGLAEVYGQRAMWSESKAEADMALSIARDLGHVDLQYRAAKALNAIFSGQRRWREAWEMQALAQRMHDSLENRELAQRVLRSQLHGDFIRQHTVDSLAHSAETTRLENARTIEALRADRNRNRIWGLGGAALLLTGGGTAFFLSDRRRRRAHAELRASRLEAQALRAQMNPHFLFNALNSINDYVQENEAQLASDYLTRFAKLTRQVLEASRMDEILLSRDLSILRQYMELEQMRLKGKFEYTITVSPEVDPDTVMVPPMILQPFVENAIWHGLSRMEGKGQLQVEVARSEREFLLSVQDNGVGMVTNNGAQHGEGRSLGLEITGDRLRRAGGGGFRFMDLEQGCRVDVRLPT